MDYSREGSPTRGWGLLEGYLAKRRAAVAENLIMPEHRSGRILDLGCGHIPYFLIRTDFGEKIGSDREISDGAKQLCRDHGIELLEHDLSTHGGLPFQAQTFATITMLAVIEHFPENTGLAVLREAHRCLQPGGAMIVTTPNAWTDRMLRLMAKCRLVSTSEIEEHQAAYTASSLKDLFVRAGFPAQRVTVKLYLLRTSLLAHAVKS